jgi:CheY-like chemotaxis protein
MHNEMDELASTPGSSVATMPPSSDVSVRILVVDDHQGFRDVLRTLIDSVPGFDLVGQATSGEEAVRAVDRLSPELVLMDVVMPGMGGIAAARVIVTRYPGVAVMLISVDDPAPYLEPDHRDLRDAVACARKQDLRPSLLEETWEVLHR